MPIRIEMRRLTDEEIGLLLKELTDIAHIVYVHPRQWKRFGSVYVASYNGAFAGVCAVVDLGTWQKIGPIVVRKSFRGRGIGKALISRISQNPDRNLIAGSSNQRLWSILYSHGYTRIPIHRTPRRVRVYLVCYVIQNMGIRFVHDAVKKKLVLRRGEYRVFVKKHYPDQTSTN